MIDTVRLQYASILYAENASDKNNGIDPDEAAHQEIDIEKEINQEVSGIKSSKKDTIFLPVKIDIQCGKHCF